MQEVFPALDEPREADDGVVEEIVDDEYKSVNFWRVPLPALELPAPLPPSRTESTLKEPV